MSARIERPEVAALFGGVLVMLGAWLPWLTMFAGLQQYRGLLGLHGHIVFAGGALAIVASIGTLRTRRRWIRSGTALLGAMLLGFIGWLLTGLAGMLQHGLSAMLVPRAGPGLFVSLVGAALITIGPAIAARPRATIATTVPSGPKHVAHRG
jgi:hypothetical protein